MRKRYYFILFNLGLLMMIFTFGLGNPNPDNKLNSLVEITGNVVKVDDVEGCAKNIYNDDTILRVIYDRIDFSRYYNLVVIKSPGEYYVLYYHNGKLFDSFKNAYKFEKGDLVCYDFQSLPDYVEVR